MALLIGPMFMARSGNSPLNSYLRRDVGVWAAINSLIHFWAGTVVSMNPLYIGNFVNLPDSIPSGEIRQQLFNGGSIVGAVVAILFLLLLALSSDRAIRVLGSRRWKSFQKVSIWVLWLTVIHGIAFQVLEGRWAPLVFMTVLAIAVIALRRTSRRIARASE